MKITEFKKLIDNKKLKGAYIFTGEEQGLMQYYIKKIGLPMYVMSNLSELNLKLSNKNLFAVCYKSTVSRVYILKNDLSVLDNEDLFRSVINKLDTNILIMHFDSIDKRKTFFKHNSKNIVQFDKLSNDNFYALISNKIPGITRESSDVLTYACNNDMNRILLEIDKLIALNKPITKELILENVARVPEDVIFDMTRFVINKKIALAYQCLSELKYHNESPIKIISLLYQNFRNVFIIQNYQEYSNAEIAKKTGLTTGQVFMIKPEINKYSYAQLLAIINIIGDANTSIIAGKLDMEISVEVILAKINQLIN